MGSEPALSPSAPNTLCANRKKAYEGRWDALDEYDVEHDRRHFSLDPDNLRCKAVKNEGSVPKVSIRDDCHNLKTGSMSYFYKIVCEDLNAIAVWEEEATSSIRKYPHDDCLFKASPTFARDHSYLKRAGQNFYKGLINHKEAVQMCARQLHDPCLN